MAGKPATRLCGQGPGLASLVLLGRESQFAPKQGALNAKAARTACAQHEGPQSQSKQAVQGPPSRTLRRVPSAAQLLRRGALLKELHQKEKAPVRNHRFETSKKGEKTKGLKKRSNKKDFLPMSAQPGSHDLEKTQPSWPRARRGPSISQLLGQKTPKELYEKEKIPLSELLDAGCTVSELREAGIETQAFLTAGISVTVLRASGFDAEELHRAGIVPSALRKGGFSALELREAGVPTRELCKCGFALQDLRRANVKSHELYPLGHSVIELRGAGFSPAILWEEGISLPELRTAFNLSELRIATSVTVSDMRRAGASFLELYKAGWDIKDLQEDGCDILSLVPQVGLRSLRLRGVSAALLCSGGIRLQRLYMAGFSARELLEAGFFGKDLLQVGFPPHEVRGDIVCAASWSRA
mmetsp:Transcript_63363/g.148809  ORF Transcript_63363/g.148809 Transcript_63363/m.148809 type:complete len:413 (-) Transcript_63363:234-1472(-)